eukprot:TRINITY_DN92242_c0_g1_i1.p1 TRINITY_DN92242_c0_g1~~TRINITY_DN92242_c0_g1_i1.p1  ORF type:complete len:286 (-),score=55.31 TRINITY_DN92242_c0_g1_i1:37-894(-)
MTMRRRGSTLLSCSLLLTVAPLASNLPLCRPLAFTLQGMPQEPQSPSRRSFIAAAGTVAAAAVPALEGAWARSSAAKCDDTCLADIFGNFANPNSQEERDVFFSFSEDSITYAYGTINPRSVDAILSRLQFDSTDVFSDIGSGIGNVALQVYANTAMRRVRGIEYLQQRHLDAVKHVQDFKRKYGVDEAREILLVNGDVCKEDFSDSTIVFSSSTCFDDRGMECLTTRSESNPHLKYLITSRELAPSTKLRPLGVINNLETSWSTKKDVSYWVYSNKPGVKLLDR